MEINACLAMTYALLLTCSLGEKLYGCNDEAYARIAFEELALDEAKSGQGKSCFRPETPHVYVQHNRKAGGTSLCFLFKKSNISGVPKTHNCNGGKETKQAAKSCSGDLPGVRVLFNEDWLSSPCAAEIVRNSCMFSITSVRNPLERLPSHLHNLISEEKVPNSVVNDQFNDALLKHSNRLELFPYNAPEVTQPEWGCVLLDSNNWTKTDCINATKLKQPERLDRLANLQTMQMGGMERLSQWARISNRLQRQLFRLAVRRLLSFDMVIPTESMTTGLKAVKQILSIESLINTAKKRGNGGSDTFGGSTDMRRLSRAAAEKISQNERMDECLHALTRQRFRQQLKQLRQ